MLRIKRAGETVLVPSPSGSTRRVVIGVRIVNVDSVPHNPRLRIKSRREYIELDPQQAFIDPGGMMTDDGGVICVLGSSESVVVQLQSVPQKPLHAIATWVDEEVQGDTAELLPRLAQPGSPDGVYPPNLFVWKGQRHELPPQLWQLLALMWERETAALQQLVVQVWGRDDVKSATINSTVSKLNTKLLEIGCRMTLHVKSGHIVKTVAD